MRKFFLAAALTAAMIAVPAIATAGGEPDDDLQVDLVSYVEPLRFALAIDDEAIVCDTGTFAVTLVEILAYPSNDVVGTATPLSVTEDPTDPNRATLVLPSDTRPGGIQVTAVCSDGEEFEAIGANQWASIPVTKVVTGAAPADATFTVNVTCTDLADDVETGDFATQELDDNFAVDLAFGAAGGTRYVYIDGGTDCTVTEPVTGGATAVDISPPQVSTDPAPAAYPVTVTNTFAVEIEPNFTG